MGNDELHVLAVCCYCFVTKATGCTFCPEGYRGVTICYRFVTKTAKGMFDCLGYRLLLL